MNPEQEVQALEKQRVGLEEQLRNVGPILRGSVVELSRPCTNRRCRKCKEGVRHPAIYHSVSKNSKTHLTYIRKASQEQALRWNTNWRELLHLADQISEINLKILKLTGKSRRGVNNNK